MDVEIAPLSATGHIVIAVATEPGNASTYESEERMFRQKRSADCAEFEKREDGRDKRPKAEAGEFTWIGIEPSNRYSSLIWTTFAE